MSKIDEIIIAALARLHTSITLSFRVELIVKRSFLFAAFNISIQTLLVVLS